MHVPTRQLAAPALIIFVLAGCAATPFQDRSNDPFNTSNSSPHSATPISIYRAGSEPRQDESAFPPDAELIDYIEFALRQSPELEAAYQRWQAAIERVPQAGALPDPRLSLGVFANEVETRVGAQQAKVGLSQKLPWSGELSARTDAATAEAKAAWYAYRSVRRSLIQRLSSALYELDYLDRAIQSTQENIQLLNSFEEVIRVKYRVGAGSHPDLIRTQVELGMLNDRYAGLLESRAPALARVNAILHRESSTPIEGVVDLPSLLVDSDVDSLIAQSHASNPDIQGFDERAEAQRRMTQVAQYSGKPTLTVAIDYTLTDDAINSSMPESGDDPVLIGLSMNIPIWREKYDASVRESIARRLSITRDKEAVLDRLNAMIHDAYFRHIDSDRRVTLYQQSLIPKAVESLQSSMAGYRAGQVGLTDVLDTERTLLEFSLAADRARADRGIALASLFQLVDSEIPTRPSGPENTADQSETEVNP